MDDIIKNLEQITIEDTYSRKNIRYHVMKLIDIEHKVFRQAVNRFIEWTRGDYYASKKTRIQKLKLQIEPEDVITEIMAATLILEKETQIQGIATQLSQNFDFEDMIEGVITASEILTILSKEKWSWYEIVTPQEAESGSISIKCKNFSRTLKDFIDNTMYLPPLIVKPKNWTTNTQGGYLSVTDKCILGNLVNTFKYCRLEILNHLQSIKWKIDTNISILPEESNKPIKGKALEEFNIQKSITKSLINNYKDGFYMVWKYDRRGRMYSQGYHINLQSTKYKRALFNFAKEELLTGD